MNDFAKIFIFFGIILLGTGALMLFLGKLPGIGRLPGDILIKKENFTFYFPVTTSLIISVILSLLFFFFNRR